MLNDFLPSRAPFLTCVGIEKTPNYPSLPIHPSCSLPPSSVLPLLPSPGKQSNAFLTHLTTTVRSGRGSACPPTAQCQNQNNKVLFWLTGEHEASGGATIHSGGGTAPQPPEPKNNQTHFVKISKDAKSDFFLKFCVCYPPPPSDTPATSHFGPYIFSPQRSKKFEVNRNRRSLQFALGNCRRKPHPGQKQVRGMGLLRNLAHGARHWMQQALRSSRSLQAIA